MTRTIRVCAAGGLVLAALAPLHAQSAASQGAGRRQTGVPFTVEVRHMRAGGEGNSREVTLLLRFRNVTQRPLTLAYEPNSQGVTDDRGNRGNGGGLMFGMGAFAPPALDASFTLAPGSSADAIQRFELRVPQGRLFGTEFAMQMAVRELERLSGERWRPTASHSFSFDALREGATFPARGVPSPSTDACAGRPDCSASEELIAELARVSNSMHGSTPRAQLSVRFRNTSRQPVTLCMMQYASFGMDDRGHSYLAFPGTVRAMPVCEQQGGNVTFTIAPGASRDASLEYSYRGPNGAVRGTSAALNLAVQQLALLPGDQVRPVRVIPVLFRDVPLLAGERAVAAGGATPGGTAANAPLDGPTAQPDPCANVAHCYVAGPFSAQLTRVVASRVASTHYLRLGVRIRNLTAERLVLCLSSGSGVADDDRQNRYLIREDIGVRGIGLCQGHNADTQFTIAPGATRDASLEFHTGIYAGTVLGTSAAISFALDQLNLLPGDQIQKAGQYVVNFEAVSATEGRPVNAKAVNANAVNADTVNATARRLLDRLRGALKKP